MEHFRAIEWFQLYRSSDQHFLSQLPRLEQLSHELKDPRDQHPDLCVFLGAKTKDSVLPFLFPQNTFRRSANNGHAINLRLDFTSAETRYPLFWADFNPQERPAIWLSSQAFPPPRLNWTYQDSQSLLTIFFGQCLLSFTDLVCIFADDCGGVEEVLSLIQTIVELASSLKQTRCSKPNLLIVLGDDAQDIYIAGLRKISPRIDDIFSACFLQILQDGSSDCCLTLRRQIMKCLDVTRTYKHSLRLSFSMAHFGALIKQGVTQWLKDNTKPLDRIACARSRLEVPQRAEHLSSFLALTQTVPYETIQLLIASSLTMDAYPPDMHLFDETTLFLEVYRSDCWYACRAAFESPSLADAMCTEIQKEFETFGKSVRNGILASNIRLEQSEQQGRYLTHIHSNETCLMCLARKPEHTLPCCHAVCDCCVRIFGQEQIGREHNFLMDYCPICRAGAQKILQLKPHTAAARLLSIDGGGARGVIPLETLSLLQELLGSDCEIQEFFDYAIGTSAGGLIVLGLFARRWSVQKAKDTFKSFTKRFFESAKRADKGLWDSFRHVLNSVIKDYVYDIGDLERTLMELFGQENRILDGNTNTSTKFAVTAATSSEPAARLFTNYNGYCDLEATCGYAIERPKKVQDEPRLWQTGRATSAVPVLFPPIQIKGLGTFWDGALSRHNNPINLALWESRRIWPSCAEPDVVISLGTGMKSDTKSQETRTPKLWSFLRDRGLPKLWDSLMFFLEGEEPWKDLRNRLNHKARQDYFRFNFPILDSPVAIDDTTKMDTLTDCVRLQSQKGHDFYDAISALLVSCFFFELCDVPKKHRQGLYYCRGVIKCRFTQPRSLIRVILKSHSPEVRLFSGDKDLGILLSEDSVCSVCCRYSQIVELLTETCDQPLELCFRWQDESQQPRSRRLSAMSENLNWFIETQKLNNAFGTQDHGTPGALRCNVCVPRKSPRPRKSAKRVLPFEDASARKRVAILPRIME